MQQIAMSGEDWKSDLAQDAEAGAGEKLDEAGLACAKALNAASKALSAYLQACRDCNDARGDEQRAISYSRHRLTTDISEYAGFLETKHSRERKAK